MSAAKKKSPRREFKRSISKHSYRKIFLLSVEGTETEIQYFNIFNTKYSTVKVKYVDRKKYGSSPEQVLKDMEKELEQLQIKGLKNPDEAWLVVDKDKWSDEQLTELCQWAEDNTNDKYGFALSNPKFEFWLLLHFEDGKKISSAKICDEKLKRHLPNYNKNIDVKKITDERIQDAINRAKQKDTPPCKKWPKRNGSTVYKLVENILAAQKTEEN